jgi:uncharacterized protein YjiK
LSPQSPPSSPVFGSSLFAAQPEARWELPARLREISGLACTPDGRLMGHEDETATIFHLDFETGEVVKRFAVGRPAVRGDFEGLAIDQDGVFYLTTSKGQMYRFREGDDRSYVSFESFDTGMRHVAEVEGLTCRPDQDSVILACKCNYSAALQGALALYAWSPGNPEQHARPYLNVPLWPIAEAIGVRAFHASSVEIDPRTGRIVVLAGPENAMVELDPYGALLAARHLGELHSQAEGSAILPNGALMIADEGGRARAHLARYARLGVSVDV